MFFLLTFLRTIGLLVVSNNPPLPLVIKALPKSEDSIAVRPNGSSHREGTMEIDVLL